MSPGLAEALVAWQRQHGRHDLPWQRTREPYRVWLSEVMLQQTQVSTVLTYYARFLDRFPDVQALAAAPLDEVLALWSGLGYYSRARHLHRCAQQVMAVHGGRFPGSAAELATLPGIGRSTAAAIAAFCFGERVAILDGNVKRVLSRVLGFDGDLALPAQERALWDLAQALLPSGDVAAYTQGLMDLGATLCTARRPDCGRCPWQAPCAARAQGQPQAYPVKTRRVQRRQQASVLLWLQHGELMWLSRRPDGGIWGGLWCLPELADEATLQALTAGWPGQGKALPTVQHALTHRDWALQPVHWQLPARLGVARRQALEATLAAATGPGRWLPKIEALALGLPAPVRRLLQA